LEGCEWGRWASQQLRSGNMALHFDARLGKMGKMGKCRMPNDGMSTEWLKPKVQRGERARSRRIFACS